jgi:nucleotide-diphospho-sugar transferase
VTSTGVLYIASGDKYIRAAIRSAESVRKHCPGLPIHLFADWESHGFPFDRAPAPFSSVAAIEAPHVRSKVDYMAQSPFDRTLYLDTDTAVCVDIREMFRLLERFDIAATHAHHRNGPTMRAPMNASLPIAFPQYNTGVILFRKTPDVLRFLEQWRTEYHQHSAEYKQDQATMRQLLWKADLRLATLPPEYNLRYIKYRFLLSKNEAIPKIYHLRRYHVGWFAWVFRPLGKLQARTIRWLRTHKGGFPRRQPPRM